jgi:hypothetical protein
MMGPTHVIASPPDGGERKKPSCEGSAVSLIGRRLSTNWGDVIHRGYDVLEVVAMRPGKAGSRRWWWSPSSDRRSRLDGRAGLDLQARNGLGVGITLFESEGTMRRRDEALNRMNPGQSGARSSVEFFEVPVNTL